MRRSKPFLVDGQCFQEQCLRFGILILETIRRNMGIHSVRVMAAACPSLRKVLELPWALGSRSDTIKCLLQSAGRYFGLLAVERRRLDNVRPTPLSIRWIQSEPRALLGVRT